MLRWRSLPGLFAILLAILLAESCSVPSSSVRRDNDLPGLPRLTIANFRPQVREQVQQAFQTVARNPRDAEANGRLGMLLHAFEQFESAAICYRRAQILDSRRFPWAYYLGLSLAMAGKNAEAAA